MQLTVSPSEILVEADAVLGRGLAGKECCRCFGTAIYDVSKAQFGLESFLMHHSQSALLPVWAEGIKVLLL